jgi:uncharacterized protein
VFHFWKKSKYQASRYNRIVIIPDGTLLFNQINGGLILLDDIQAKNYHEIINGMPYRDKDFYQYLKEEKFIIPVGYDEREEIQKRWNEVTSSSAKKALTIVPTDRCNLGCGYCYEDKRDWANMSEEVQSKIKVFVEEYLTATPSLKFSVVWFGGEPTLHLKAIENLSAFFIEICDLLGIEYDPFMVTNGTTLTDHVVDRLEKCKIKGVQITVDGLQEEHDASRPYLRDLSPHQMNEAQKLQRKKIDPSFEFNILNQPTKPRSSFTEIMQAVRRLRERGFFIKLRANVDFHNRESVKKLFQLIRSEGLCEKHESGGMVRVYSHPIFEGCSGCSLNSMSKEQHAQFESELVEEDPEYFKWREGSLVFTGSTCTANMDFQFIINQNGKLVKCWHHATDNDYAIGTVDDLEFARKGSRGMDPLRFDPLEDTECRECPVLPICMGGCKSNNQFSQLGYNGKHEMGCNDARYSLDAKIVRLYNRTLKQSEE